MSTKKKNGFSSDLELKIKACESEVQYFVTALKTENYKLHQKIAKLQAEKVSFESRIKVTEKEYSNYRHEHPSVELSDEEMQRLQKQSIEEI